MKTQHNIGSIVTAKANKQLEKDVLKELEIDDPEHEKATAAIELNTSEPEVN